MSCIQQKRMSMALDHFCSRVLLENAISVVLSTYIIVGSCGYSIYTRVVRSETASCAFINYTPISASAANAMIFVIILYTL